MMYEKGQVMQKSISLLLGLLLSASAWSALTPDNYHYPIDDKYDATVIGTPPEFSAVVSKKTPVKVHTIKSIGNVPDLFWYDDGLQFSTALQKHKAPLVFNIAGTGAAYDSAKMIKVQAILYHAGFHVINISSPTYLDFLLAASTSHMPGYAPDDAKDIYRVMQQAYDMVKDNIEVSEFHITGYSLGALHSAFIANIDKREKKFNLQKVYMINPPVSLYNSVVVLDRLAYVDIPSVNGVPQAGTFLDHVIKKLAKDYQPKRGVHLDDDFLYHAYKENRGEGVFSDKHTAAGLIGFSFRLSSGAIVFASDVMNNVGYIVPKGKIFKRNENLDYYARASMMVTFQEYVDDMLIPMLQKKYPNYTSQDIIRNTSLHAIEDFMVSNPNIHIATNRDEVILADGELAYMESVMGDKITVYPTGGHCGNIDYTVNARDMVAFLKGGVAQ
ncbi:MAG TPA: hypothetical protein VIM96_05275 [Pseudomonadales bacterium]